MARTSKAGTEGARVYAVFTIVESDSPTGAPVWRKIGTGYRNRDGSLTIELDALPMNGKLHVREVESERPTNPIEGG